MRHLLQIEVNGALLVGTYHRPRQSGLSGSLLAMSRVPAVVLLNFGQVCRSGPANLSTEMADRLCEHGYPVYRFDMPGLGDTDGELPEYHETYWRYVEAGGQTPWVCALMDILKRQFAVSGFVLGGLCGGAITSIFASEQRRSDVAGLLLMEPAVRGTPAIRTETMPGSAPATPPQGIWKRLWAYRGLVEHRARLWIRSTACLDPLRRTCRMAEQRLWTLHGRPLPAVMNAPLIRCWQRVQATGLPMLVMAAPGSDREFIKQALFPPSRRRQMSIVDMDGTNHLFTAGDGKERAIEEAEQWMCSRYPVGASNTLALEQRLFAPSQQTGLMAAR